jgi:hypothetical protein
VLIGVTVMSMNVVYFSEYFFIFIIFGTFKFFLNVL